MALISPIFSKEHFLSRTNESYVGSAIKAYAPISAIFSNKTFEYSWMKKTSGFKLVEALHKLLDFCFFVQETELIKMRNIFSENLCTVFNGLFKGFCFKDELEQGTIHDEIV